MFWPGWRLPGRAVVVVEAAEADRGLRARDPEVAMSSRPWGAEVPVCGAVLAGTGLADCKRCVLTVDAGLSRGRGVASVAVLAPAGDREAVTAKVRALESARDVDLIAAEDRELAAAGVAVTLRAATMECVSVAVRHRASAEDGIPAREEARDLAPTEAGRRDRVEVPVMVPAEVRVCVPVEARNPGSAGVVDLAPVANRDRSRVKVRDLIPTET